MASLSAVFTEKERTNWLKAWLAVDIAKSGLEQFVENEATTVHADIYNTVWSSIQAPAACIGCHTANLLKCPTQGVCNKRGAHGICTSMHDNAAKQPRTCPVYVCNKVHDEIVQQHKYARPSWKNTAAEQWAHNPWQIVKTYFPPDGYAEKNSVQETDFNGIVSFMMNCKHFDNKFSFTIAPGNNNYPCLLTKARDIGRTVRHSSQCKLTDLDLQDIFTTLTSLLTDTTCLVNDVAAQVAVKKLAELKHMVYPKQLEKDVLKITAEEMIHLLEAAQDTLRKVENIADKSLDEMQMHLERCRKDLNAHMEECKMKLDDHAAKCRNEMDAHVSKTVESTYEQSCKELIECVKKLYNDKLNYVTISPFNDHVDEKLQEVYMPIKMRAMLKEKGAFKKPEKIVTKYKDLFLPDDKVNRRIFIRGEAGCGKTKFLAKLALDWCEPTPSHMESVNNTDLETSESSTDDCTESYTSSDNYEESDNSCSWDTSDDTEFPNKTDLETSELVIYDRNLLNTSLLNSEKLDNSFSRDFSNEYSVAYHNYVSCLSETIGHDNNNSKIFDDLDVLQGYVFVFHITLRNSVKQFDVYTMIKEQIIDSIYSQEDREKAYRLLNEIMKHERCLVLLDGLDEWTGPGDNHNLPTLVVCHSQSVLLITTRHWKLAERKMMHSDIDALLQLEGLNKPFELSKKILSRLIDKDELEKKHSAFKHYIAKQKLYNLLSSPMMLSAIVCAYLEGVELNGSKCKIYVLLLESLFKKANSEMCEFQHPPLPCFAGTQYIQPNMEQFNRLAELAFYLLFVNTKENSFLFSITELKKFKIDEQEQKDFALKSGILSETRNASTLRSTSSFMFVHLSMQEFLAAYHIARNSNLINAVIAAYLNRQENSYRDVTQVFIFLCGMDVSSAEKLSRMMDERHNLFVSDRDELELILDFFSFQDIILAGYIEAVENGYARISLKLSHNYFGKHNITELERIWANNTDTVISLKVNIDDMNRRISRARDEPVSHMKSDLISCNNLKRLHLTGHGILLKDFTSVVTSELSVWIVLNSADSTQCTHLALVLPSIEDIKLHLLTFSFSWLCSLLKMLLTRDQKVECTLWSCNILSCEEGATNKSVTSIDATINTLTKEVLLCLDDEHDLWKAIHGLNIKSLSLRGMAAGGFRVNHKESLSQSLLSLTQLEKLSIEVNYGSPGLWEALNGLNIKSLSLCLSLHPWWEGSIDSHKELLCQTLSSISQLEQLSICVNEESPGLWEALRGMNIKSLSLSGRYVGFKVKQTESLFNTLSSLTELETFSLHVNTYIALQLPPSLQYLNIYFAALLPSKLRDIVDTLAACTHKLQSRLDFGCASDVNRKDHIPLQEYIPIQQELCARKNVSVKRFRIYEWQCKSNTSKCFNSAGFVLAARDIGCVDDNAHHGIIVIDDAHQWFVKSTYLEKINIVSISLQICPDTISL